MAAYKLVTPPATEPLLLADVKLFLRVDNVVEDSIITNLIIVARQYVENYLNGSLITQTWDYYLNYDEIGVQIFSLSKNPIQSITDIKYFDINNTLQTLPVSSYDADIVGEPATIKITSLPAIYNKLNTMVIRFVAGYGNAASVPMAIKQAMLMLIGHWYEHREAVSFVTSSSVEMAVESLLYPYKIFTYQYNPLN